jgi:alpha-ribazole phosphatase
MDLFLIRHTTPDIAEGICYGQKDIGLAETFSEELKSLQAKLPAGHQTFRVYSSPLNRCCQLAESLSGHNIITDQRLMELDFGKWEGRAWDSIKDEELQPWMKDFVDVEPPGGESYCQLYSRVTDWWEEFIKTEQGKVLLVTHAGVIRCLLSHVLGLPLENSFRLSISYGSISKISRQQNHNTINYINR